MQYAKTIFLLFTLGGGIPALAALGPFDLLRSVDASALKTSAVHDGSNASPYQDAAGSLGDGQTYYYIVRAAGGSFIDVTVSKDRANDRLELSFDDTVPVPPADASLSTVSVAPAIVPADGMTTAMITIVPKDAVGQVIGPGLDLTLDLFLLDPAVQVGEIQDMGDGSYVVYVASSRIGQALVEIDVDGVVLDDQPALTFQSVFDDQFPVNVTGVGDQTRPSVGQATDGGSVMIYQGQDSDGAGILGRVFNANGSPAGGEFVVNTTTTGNQTNPDVAVAADRRFVVVWQADDVDGLGVYAQLFDTAGLPVGGEMLVNVVEGNNQQDPHVVMADDGSFVVVWKGIDSDGEGIYARMFDAFGQAISNEFIVNTAETGNQQDPQISMTGDGRFVVLWQSTSGTDGIFAQLYNSAGAPVGTAIDVHLGLNGQEGIPAVAMSDTGAFTVVWQGEDGQSIGIVARAFDAVGLPFTPAEIVVNTATHGVQDAPDVAMADDGQGLVVWHDQTNKDVRGQRFDALGAPVAKELTISDPAASKADAPATAVAGDGTSYIVLYEAEDGDGMGVFASWVPLL